MRPELRRQRRLGQGAGAEETGKARGPILTLGCMPFLGETWSSLRSGPLVSDLSHRGQVFFFLSPSRVTLKKLPQPLPASPSLTVKQQQCPVLRIL